MRRLLLPHEFPPWQSVYHYFRRWRFGSTWERVNGALRERVRAMAGRGETPSAAIVDGQSAKTTERGGPRGYDGAKKVHGRKRHLLVDTEGLVMKAKAHARDLTDRDGVRLLVGPEVAAFPHLGHLWADAGYRGAALREWITERPGLSLEIVQRRSRWMWVRNDEEPVLADFEVIKRRWVERTFAWITRNRRMIRNYGFLAETTERPSCTSA